MSNCSQINNTTIIGTSDVFYDGPQLPCSNIETCDTLTVAFEKLDELVCVIIEDVESLTNEVNNIEENLVDINNTIVNINNQLNICCPTTTTTSSSSTSTTTSTSSTTTTTTTEPPLDLICFSIFQESPGDCCPVGYQVELPLLGNGPLFNGRPTYNFLSFLGYPAEVYYNGSNWVFYNSDLGLIQPLINSNYYPVGDYIDWGTVGITGLMNSSSLGPCPPITTTTTSSSSSTTTTTSTSSSTTTTTTTTIASMCFGMGGEVPGETYFCTVEPEVGLINGKPYYKLFLPDCTTQWAVFDEPVYIWFSTSGDYVNQWVVSELYNATIGNVYSYISSGGSGSYPIGTWEVLTDQIFVYDSSIGDCSEFICFCFYEEMVGCGNTIQLPLLGNAPFQNGRPVYNFTGTYPGSLYYNGSQWIYASEELAPILQPLLNSSYYPIGTFSDWGTPGITGLIGTSILGSCPPTTTTTTTLLTECMEYVAGGELGGGTVNYNDCFGNPQSFTVAFGEFSDPFCALEGSVFASGFLQIDIIGTCEV